MTALECKHKMLDKGFTQRKLAEKLEMDEKKLSLLLKPPKPFTLADWELPPTLAAKIEEVLA